ncbi:MAG: methyltransferase family protein [Terriglobales bacterium]
MTVIRTIGWIVGIVYATIPSYWLLVHPRVEWWRRRGARLARVGPLWMLLWVVMAAITWRWRSIALYEPPWTWLAGAPLIVAGILVYRGARVNFSMDQVLGRSELEPSLHEQRLHTAGIRGRVRHPYYLGHFCELLGWTIGTGLLVLWAMLGFALVTGAIMIRAEEKELVARFGASYREYQSRVPAFLPRTRNS